MITMTMGQIAMAKPSRAAVAMLMGVIPHPSIAQAAATTSAPRLATYASMCSPHNAMTSQMMGASARTNMPKSSSIATPVVARQSISKKM